MHDDHQRSDGEALVEGFGEHGNSRGRDAVAQGENKGREIEREKLIVGVDAAPLCWVGWFEIGHCVMRRTFEYSSEERKRRRRNKLPRLSAATGY
jgi:hypothetical protein